MGLYANGLSSKFDKKKFNYNASFSLTKKKQYYHIKTKGNPKIGNPKYVIDKQNNKYTLKKLRI